MKGNGDVSYADNIDSEFSKPFEWKGLKHQQRNGGPGAGEIAFYFSLLPRESNQLLGRSCNGAEASPSAL